MAKVMRSVKNVAKGYSSTAVKVRTATSNDAWGPTGSEMSEIAEMTFNSPQDFEEIMHWIDRRLNDKGKNWRHVLKALKLLDYCLHEGSEMVVTWARKNIYVIKTLREFQYVDDDGRDVGQAVRSSAKELTALILDEERLRSERTDRKLWKPRVTGLEEFGPVSSDGPSRSRARGNERRNRNGTEEDDAELRLAMEASKYQAELDEAQRAKSRGGDVTDADLEKALKLSKEEEELRRRELEQSSANMFDEQPSLINLDNNGYDQGNRVDFGGNPMQQQMQPTGYNPYANNMQGYQVTGQPTGFDPNMYAQYNQNQMPYMPQQNTAQLNNPYAAYTAAMQDPVPQMPSPQETPLQAGSHNPWAQPSNNADSLKPLPTGSRNPFASTLAQQPVRNPNSLNSLASIPEPKSKSEFSSNYNPPVSFSSTSQPSFNTQQYAQQQSLKPPTQHSQLEELFASGQTGQDTFGNWGQTRIPAQHTAPGTFVNSAGAGLSKLNPQGTANNPFFNPTQFNGAGPNRMMPAATGPAMSNGNNPYGQQRQNNNLIDF